ncbi:hypothetical protein [Klebsiella phage Kpn74]|uniref:Uncharacterized protein n=1 Tax=Klebsiella phage Kpn74 TaxID=3044026 RepID=A0AAT9V612_9CAUD|nr:hypothetical protein [Klebsiella phage Kpn74]
MLITILSFIIGWPGLYSYPPSLVDFACCRSYYGWVNMSYLVISNCAGGFSRCQI